MATLRCAAFLAVILVLQSYSATADVTISSIIPSFGDEACKTKACGKGKCVVSNSSNFGFECQCDKGWKQARSDDDQSFKFLPCVIPNCTLNFSCSKAPAPAPDKKANTSIWNPCYWTDCGGGSCNKTSPFTHTCVCEEGYYNLFNSTVFPCYKECAIGGDCANLGIGRNSSALSPSSVDNSKSSASLLIPKVELGWLITMVTTLALVVWKYS